MIRNDYVEKSLLPDFSLWGKMREKRGVFSFDLDVTARCNNSCRHCYINLPAGDREARRKEMTLEEICDIADQAIALGALWCLISGGEPLLRADFADIYIALKKKGLLVSVFTNACLINEEHIDLFRRYPPRDMEVTVYGVSRETYEKVTGQSGSYDAFRRGLRLLLDAGIKVRLKAMALRSNVHELADIARFCRAYTKDYFRFDPLLHLRYDGNPDRNREIIEERLSPAEVAAVEQADEARSSALEKKCDDLILPEGLRQGCTHLFRCGIGNGKFNVSYDGMFRLCSSLCHPDCVYDLRKGRLADAWYGLVPKVRELRSNDHTFLEKCSLCPIINLCLWCPAHAYLENGRMDAWCEYFCSVAHARWDAIQHSTSKVDSHCSH